MSFSRTPIFYVSKIDVTFADEIGNVRKISGTGFAVSANGDKAFVTNAHNLDPRMKLGRDTDFKIKKVELHFRLYHLTQPTTATFPVEIGDYVLKIHESADVAILSAMKTRYLNPNVTLPAFDVSDLATASFLSDELEPMDPASFIGFPGKKGTVWYDENWKLPIARTVNIASHPGMSFTNRNIPTADVMLVSGLSFSGSSGSPVISHPKGIQVEAPLSGPYTPAKIIGIMSGHWWNEESENDAFRHSGLSYLTRSTAILELLT